MNPEIIHLGTVDYIACWEAMRRYTAERDANTPDQIWLVQHPPVYTLGQAAKPAELLISAETHATLSTTTHEPDAENKITHWRGIPLQKIDRGGQVTYHGPGQLIAYLLLDLKRRQLFVRELVCRIEAAVIDTLAEFQIIGTRHPGQPGIYLQQEPHIGAKIAALGLKISRGCSYHGLALNVDMDLQPFSWIHPCGQAGLETVDLASLGIKTEIMTVADYLSKHLLRQLAQPHA